MDVSRPKQKGGRQGGGYSRTCQIKKNDVFITLTMQRKGGKEGERVKVNKKRIKSPSGKASAYRLPCRKVSRIKGEGSAFTSFLIWYTSSLFCHPFPFHGM
ncbi:hypothetical protein AVEN_59241-1 [Araneus ventricosus]|uniref:Uncharacterized protein n=1 Tax=Araneus ventricosus TaxID=182803 RepID=A0A4Y2CZW7_ARAVE|nr:hypothetical protein AVEN_59241-1 [Araneus ventricosus]